MPKRIFSEHANRARLRASVWVMLARITLCIALLLNPAALAGDLIYDVRVSFHADVYISIYDDGRMTWNALPLSSPIALEAKLLLAKQQLKPSWRLFTTATTSTS